MNVAVRRAALAGVLVVSCFVVLGACASTDENGDPITPAPTQEVRTQDLIEVVTKTLPDGREVTCLVLNRTYQYEPMGFECLEPTEVSP